MLFTYLFPSTSKDLKRSSLPKNGVERDSSPGETQQLRTRLVVVAGELKRRQGSDDSDENKGGGEDGKDEEDEKDEKNEKSGKETNHKSSKTDHHKTKTSAKPKSTKSSETTSASSTETLSTSASTSSSTFASTTAPITTSTSSLPSTITSTASPATSSAVHTSAVPDPTSGIGTGGIVASAVFGSCVFIALLFVVGVYFKRWRGYRDRRRDEKRKSSLYPYSSVAMGEDGGSEAVLVREQQAPAYTMGGYFNNSNSERLAAQSYEETEYSPIQGSRGGSRFYASIDTSYRNSIADISSSELHLPDQNPRTHRRSFSYSDPSPAMPVLAESSQEDLTSFQTDIPLQPIPGKRTSYHERRDSRYNIRSLSGSSYGGWQSIPNGSGNDEIDAGTVKLLADNNSPTNSSLEGHPPA